MKTIFLAAAAAGLLASSAFAGGSDPRCWYDNAPSCSPFQSTGSTAKSDPAKSANPLDRDGDGQVTREEAERHFAREREAREFDHERQH